MKWALPCCNLSRRAALHLEMSLIITSAYGLPSLSTNETGSSVEVPLLRLSCKEKVTYFLSSLQKLPDIIRSFFMHKELQYALSIYPLTYALINISFIVLYLNILISALVMQTLLFHILALHHVSATGNVFIHMC